MAGAAMIVKIGSDVAGALVGIKQVEGSLAKLPAAAARATSGLGGISTAARSAGLSMAGLRAAAVGVVASLGPMAVAFAAFAVVGAAIKKIGDHFKGIRERAREAVEKLKEFKKTSDEITSGVAKEASETTGLIAVLKSETETRERKLGAIKELQKIQPEIFGQLKLEGTTVLGLDTAYKSYLENLRTVIAAKIKQAQLETIITRILTLQGATLTRGEAKVIDILKKHREARETTTQTAVRQADQEDRLNTLFEEQAGLLKDLEDLSKGIKVKQGSTAEPEKLKIKPKKVELDLGEAALTPIGKEILIDIFPAKIGEVRLGSDNLSDLGEKIQEAVDGGDAAIDPVRVPIEIDPNLQNLQNSLNEAIVIFHTELFSAVGESIGDAIAGQKGALNSILSVISSLLQQIGKALISYGVIKTGLDKILFSPAGIALPGGFAIALGVAAIAASQLLKGATVKARALGGPVHGRTPYIVGERGPELFVPSTSGQIVPNNRLGGISGGAAQMVSVMVTGRISGRDLVLSQAREGRYQGRNV